MTILGIQDIHFATEDIPTAQRFLDDWGLPLREGQDASMIGMTLEGARIILDGKATPGFFSPEHEGSALREIVWAVDSEEHLNSLARSLEPHFETKRDIEGGIHLIGPGGYGFGFERSLLRELAPVESAQNYPGRPVRRNQRVDFTIRPEVRHLGHIAVFIPDIETFEAATSFFIDNLAFRASDVYPGKGIFLRAPGAHDHHNIFFIHRPGLVGLHHMSFEVNDFHQVMMGGRYMQARGWKTQVGPGRHTLGSNYFWYFHSPLGGSCEYYSDMDYLDDSWEAQSWDYSPEIVAAWTMQMPETPTK